MSAFAEPLKTVVIIEDDGDVGRLLEEVFRSEGFRTVLAATGSEGILAVEEHSPMITTIDVTLPDVDGFEVIRRIREGSDTHILVVSGLASDSDVVRGMSCGADEFLAKPFRPRELRAGIRTALERPRRVSASEADPFGEAPPTPIGAYAGIWRHPRAAWTHHRDVSVDVITRTVLVDDAEVALTEAEFDLLATLLDSKRQVRTKADLAFVLGRGHDHRPSSFLDEREKHDVEMQVAALRRKLGDDSIEPRYIETVRGVGYRLTPALVPVAVAG
jgi:DNA-binding response OmpR family regulator